MNRLDFGSLQHPSAHILIEDKGSGTSLVQELRHQQIAVISINCKDDKVTRLFSTQPRFESGSVHFPVIQSNLREITARALALLTPREERVIRMRFGIGMKTENTLEQVGRQFSLTRERIRQIEAKGLRKLKHPSRSKILRSLLDN